MQRVFLLTLDTLKELNTLLDSGWAVVGELGAGGDAKYVLLYREPVVDKVKLKVRGNSK